MNKNLLLLICVVAFTSMHPYSFEIFNNTDFTQTIQIRQCTANACPTGTLTDKQLEPFIVAAGERTTRYFVGKNFITAQVVVRRCTLGICVFSGWGYPIRYPICLCKQPDALDRDQQDLEIVITDIGGAIRFNRVPRVT